MKITKELRDNVYALVLNYFKNIEDVADIEPTYTGEIYDEDEKEVIGKFILIHIEHKGKSIAFSIARHNYNIYFTCLNYPGLSWTWHYNSEQHTWSNIQPVRKAGEEDYISIHDIMSTTLPLLKALFNSN